MSGRRDAREDDSSDLGEFGAGSILRGIGNFVSFISDMLAEGVDEWSKTGEVKGLGSKGPVRGVYGISVRMGPGKSLRVDNFGNIRSAEQGSPMIDEVREPLVDVFDEKGGVLVVAEMPGISRDRIDLACDGDVLTISAEGLDHRYRRAIRLPGPVRFDLREVSYREGILKVWLPAAGAGNRENGS